MAKPIFSVDMKELNEPEKGELNKYQNICPSCFIQFSTNKRMKCHLFFCRPNKPAKSKAKSHGCDVCKKSFNYIGRLLKHMKSVHDNEKSLEPKKENYNCTKCVKTFNTKAYLKMHDKSVHTKDPIEKCKTCGKQFSNKIKFSAHTRTHTKNHICDICGSRWPKPSELNAHYFKLHASEEKRNIAKKYSCPTCPLKFYTPSTLDRHVYVHSETKSFHCNQCDYKVKTDTGLKLHIKGRHLGVKISKEKIALYNERLKLKRHEKKKRNGGLYRSGEERIKYNEYMKNLAHRERFNCPHCEKKTVNIDLHTKANHPEINPPMFFGQKYSSFIDIPPNQN